MKYDNDGDDKNIDKGGKVNYDDEMIMTMVMAMIMTMIMTMIRM